MSNNNSRATRSATTRESETRRKPWAPPAMLETPEPPAGFKYRWIRAEMMGESDKINIGKRLREGYELVRENEIDGGYALPTMDDGKHAGVIGVGGLLLAKIPVEIIAERNAYYAEQTRQQLSAIDNELRKESSSVMPIGAPQRESHTSFGNPENKPSLDTLSNEA